MRSRAPLIIFTALFLGSMTGVSGERAVLSSWDIKPSLMPVPRQMTLIPEGRLNLGPDISIALTGHRESRLERAARRMLARLQAQSGIPLSARIIDEPAKADLVFRCQGPGAKIPSLQSLELYTLSVDDRQARIEAPGPLGILRGIETFCQLVETVADGIAVPTAEIEDGPRFPWRGLLIDSCRHWMPVEVIKRNLDGMAAVKLNVLHWHLSEDQGFRVESRQFPKLHEMGSDGLFYTQDQIRDVIAYAVDRGIRVIPEFDMPGHTTAWFVGYPELASAPGPYRIERNWGIMDPCMDPTREDVYAFLDRFIREMAALFPDPFFHIGGDEVSGRHWDKNPQITAFKRKHGLKDNHDLQAYFNRRLMTLLKKHGKIMVGWDEIFHPDLPRDVVIQSWRGPDSLAETSRQGYRGILSNGYYLDHMLSAEFHYGVDPLAEQSSRLSEAERSRVLGGEACMWAEFVTPETIDSRIWPRLAVIAERLWSPAQVRDIDDMYRRMDVLGLKLEWLGLRHRSGYPLMLQRLAGFHPIHGLKALADIVEPAQYYTRPNTHSYTQQTPLNRLVDAARPESLSGREFTRLVDRWRYDPPGRPELRMQISHSLESWASGQPILEPLLLQSPLLKEIVPLAQEVSGLAEIGLQAIEFIEKGAGADDRWLANIAPLLDRPVRPAHELRIAFAPAVTRLVETAYAAGRHSRYAGLELLTVDTFREDRPYGWQPNAPQIWEIREEEGERVFHLTATGPPGKVRAPRSWALIQEYDVSDFVLSGRMRSFAALDNPNRDLVVVFRFQDPTHFTYVHFSASSDESHNIIGLVNGRDRVKINLEPSGESAARLTDSAYHNFKVTYDSGSGMIQAYLDDMTAPILTATDLTFTHGRVGIGSFDDTGSFATIILWGKPWKGKDHE